VVAITVSVQWMVSVRVCKHDEGPNDSPPFNLSSFAVLHRRGDTTAMKTKTQYRCTACGHIAPRWLGKCPACEAWGTLVEELAERGQTKGGKVRAARAVEAVAQALTDVDTSEQPRTSTGHTELDRVLGGGMMPGSIVLVGGDPGMGKSTLMLQMCSSMAQRGGALYVTGEESLHQLRQRADRLAVSTQGISVAAETSIETIAALIERMQPAVAVVDSVQTVVTEMLESSAGTVAQVRECTARLTQVAKRTGIPIVIIGHVTKDGAIAGPKVLEHMVDTVLQFEGDGMYSYRVLRALKNRFGSTNELGVFDMTSAGMRDVSNPSEVLLSQRHGGQPGTAIVAVMEGTRPLLIEVQALVSPTGYSMPQRVSTGYDGRRLQMLLAILEKRGGVQVRQSDVFVNVAGGIAIQDPAVDLGVAAAVVSSVTDMAIGIADVFIGELGLTGEVRHVAYAEQRVSEALRLGMKRVYLPAAAVDGISGEARSALSPVDRIAPFLNEVFG